MKIFQAGVPRSGNLWIYRTIQKMLEATSTPNPSLAKVFRESIARTGYIDPERTFVHDVISIKPEGVFWEPTHQSKFLIHHFDNYLVACTHLWTHQPFCEERSELFQKFTKIIYIIRDPRDVLISNSKYLFTDRTITLRPREDESEDSQKFIEDGHFKRAHGWIRHVGSYLRVANRFPNMYFVFYERFLEDFDSELDNLSHFLEFELNDEQKATIKDAVSFESMHKEKPLHVRKGAAGQWETVLTAEQIQNIKVVAGPFLEFLGYGADSKLETLPQLPPLELLIPDSIDQMIVESGRERRKLLLERNVETADEDQLP